MTTRRVPTQWKLVREKALLVSTLLLVSGSWLYLATLSKAGPGGPTAIQYWNLIGNTLIQTGAVALILDLINLKRYATEEMVGTLLSSEDYLSRLNSLEQELHLKRIARARFPSDGGVEQAVDWLVATLTAPPRSSYRAEIELSDEPAEERFTDSAPPLPDSVLRIKASFTYRTDANTSRRPVRINGDGVIHSQLIPIPASTELTRRFRAGRLHEEECLVWVRHVLQPSIKVTLPSHPVPLRIEPDIGGISLSESSNGTLWLEFDVTCQEMLMQPGEQAWVTYTHRQLCNRQDNYVWRSSARTYDFSFRAIGFQDYQLMPIANLASQSTVRQLDLLDDEIRCSGMILPESMFAFAWSLWSEAQTAEPRAVGRRVRTTPLPRPPEADRQRIDGQADPGEGPELDPV
ncbi:hypothetical protein [Streptomyces sp. NPDC001978]|uniref:hypothetical protein n=1 Tax=Streptomyces sp. NPDC001978 TaxID=3364627 RepID=UPI00368F7AF9